MKDFRAIPFDILRPCMFKVKTKWLSFFRAMTPYLDKADDSWHFRLYLKVVWSRSAGGLEGIGPF